MLNDTFSVCTTWAIFLIIVSVSGCCICDILPYFALLGISPAGPSGNTRTFSQAKAFLSCWEVDTLDVWGSRLISVIWIWSSRLAILQVEKDIDHSGCTVKAHISKGSLTNLTTQTHAHICTNVLHTPTAIGHGHMIVINVGHQKVPDQTLSVLFPFLTVPEAARQQGPAVRLWHMEKETERENERGRGNTQRTLFLFWQ